MIEQSGLDGLDTFWRHIQEEKRELLTAVMALFPLARTPGDNKGVAAMRSYQRRLERMLKQIAPWVESDKFNMQRKRRTLSQHDVKSGEVVVILDEHDHANDPLYKGATIRQR